MSSVRVTEWRVAWRVRWPNGSLHWHYKTYMSKESAVRFYEWLCEGGANFDHNGNDMGCVDPVAVRLSSRQIDRHPWRENDRYERRDD